MIPTANGRIWGKCGPNQHCLLLLWAIISLVGFASCYSVPKLETCKKPACMKMAPYISGFMDITIDPCENFYEFTCGKYLKDHKGRTMNFDVENNSLRNVRLERLLAQPIIPDEIAPFALLKQYYQSCIAFKNATLHYTEEQCINFVLNDLDVAAGALYTRTYVTAPAKGAIDDVVKHLRQQFRTLIEQTSWMDNSTRSYALKKAYAMKERIAYPEEFLNDTALIEYYSELKFESNDYAQIRKDVAIFKSSDKRKNIGYYNRLKWYEQTQPNSFAGYSPNYNLMLINAGILSGRMFHQDLPLYKNFGGIGMVVGHELMHSVDNGGSTYDIDGNRGKDWWSPESRAMFEKKTQCILDQYNSYTDPETNIAVDGSRTLGENIADNGGFELAYLAYQNAQKNIAPQSLPGFEKYTSNQMFWISLGTTWCTTLTTEQQRKSMLEDEHTVARFRLNGALSNSENFARDFECKPESKMNRPNKCEW